MGKLGKLGKLGNHSKGLVFGAISGACWGTYGTLLNLLTQMGIEKVTLITLVPIVLMIYASIKAATTKKNILVVNYKILICMAFHGLVIMNGVNYCYVRAIATVPVGIVAVLNFSNVIIVMLASKIFFQYRLTVHKIGAVFGALLGISLILGLFGTGKIDYMAGIGWAIIIPFGYGISLVLYRFYMNKDVHEDAILFWVNAFAAVFVLGNNPPWQISADIGQAMAAASHPAVVLLVLLGFCLVPLVGSYYTFFKAYQYVEPTYVSLCYALDPATAAILGYTIFGQNLSVSQLIGVGIVVAAILYIKIREEKEDPLLAHEAVPH